MIQASTPLSARSSAATLAALQQFSALQSPSASWTSTLRSQRSSNARQVDSVSGKSTPVSMVNTPRFGFDVGQQIYEHRLLLLEGAGQHEAGVVALDGERERLARLLEAAFS